MATDPRPDQAWQHVVADLRAYRDAQRQAWGDIDDVTIGRYLAGDCTPEEIAQVEAEIHRLPQLGESMELVKEVLSGLEAAALETQGAVEEQGHVLPLVPSAFEPTSRAAASPAQFPAAAAGRRAATPLFGRGRWAAWGVGLAAASLILGLAFKVNFQQHKIEDLSQELVALRNGMYGNGPEIDQPREVGVTLANLRAAADLPTERRFCRRVARLFEDGFEDLNNRGIAGSELSVQCNQYCENLVQFLEDNGGPLGRVNRTSLIEQCKTWSRAFQAIPRPGRPSEEVTRLSAEQLDDVVDFLNRLSTRG